MILRIYYFVYEIKLKRKSSWYPDMVSYGLVASTIKIILGNMKFNLMFLGKINSTVNVIEI